MPMIEHRPIYQSGKSSFAITLPAGWVRYFRLKPGDKVEVEVDGELIIRPVKREVVGGDHEKGQSAHA